jgi:hypothetical protein
MGTDPPYYCSDVSDLHRLIIFQRQRRQHDRSAYHTHKTKQRAVILFFLLAESVRVGKRHKRLSAQYERQCFAATKPVRMDRHVQKWSEKCHWRRMVRAPMGIDGQNTFTVACWWPSMHLPTSHTFSTQQLYHCTSMLFSDASDKGSGHLDATTGERQVNSDVKIRHCYNVEITCLRFKCAFSSESKRIKKKKKISWRVHSDVSRHYVISTQSFGF